MGYFQLGPADAALGTIFAQTISVIVALVVIRCKQKGIRLRKLIQAESQYVGRISAYGRSYIGFITLPYLEIVSSRCANSGRANHAKGSDASAEISRISQTVQCACSHP